MSRRRRERPIKRVNPSGRERWVARYTGMDGQRRSAGTFGRRHEAQDAIDAAYDSQAHGAPETVRGYAATWTERYPRATRTNVTNESRIAAVLEVELDGRKLADWPFRDLRRRQAVDLVDHMLRVQRRAASGAQNVLRTLSAMAEDAITDEIADFNFVRGVRVRANDPRAIGETRPPTVFTFAQMHRFALQGGRWEPMLRVITDCGLRLGEVVGLERRDFDGQALHLRGAAHAGRFVPGDQPTKNHLRTVPCPPSVNELLLGMPARIDTPLLFPTPTGRIWHESNFRRDVWNPTTKAAGIGAQVGDRWKPGIRPQDCRHSWVTHLRAAGIDPADLAQVAGHTVETATARYTHALGRSDDQIRQVIG
jgi:integrase